MSLLNYGFGPAVSFAVAGLVLVTQPGPEPALKTRSHPSWGDEIHHGYHDHVAVEQNVDTGELQYYSQLRMKDNPLWVRVTEVFTGKPINVFEIAQKVSQTDTNAFLLAQRYTDSLSTLRSIEKSDLPTQTVPTHASLENAITIFDLVNSQGTKLTDAELALMHITGKWSVARRVMKSKQQELSKAHFYFDLTFMTRALTAVVCQRALFETIHSRPKPELESGWAKLREIIDYLITLLPGRAHVHSTVADQLGAGYSPYIKVRFEPLNGHQLCVIDVERSSEPAYLKGQHGQELWVRLASTSRRLDAEEAVRHVQANW